MGQRSRRENTVSDPNLRVQLKLHQVAVSPRVKFGCVQSQQAVEQVEVGENRREVLAVPLAVHFLERQTIESDLAFLGVVKPGDHFGERRFSATVTARDEDKLSTPKRQVQRAERKCMPFNVGWVPESDTV